MLIQHMPLNQHSKLCMCTGHPGAQRGPVMITGGTGALGTLMGCWSAAQQHGGVLLLGRSGRLSRGDDWPSRAMGCITLQSCDMGAQADADAAIRQPRRSFAAALHAGAHSCLPLGCHVVTRGQLRFVHDLRPMPACLMTSATSACHCKLAGPLLPDPTSCVCLALTASVSRWRAGGWHAAQADSWQPASSLWGQGAGCCNGGLCSGSHRHRSAAGLFQHCLPAGQCRAGQLCCSQRSPGCLGNPPARPGEALRLQACVWSLSVRARPALLCNRSCDLCRRHAPWYHSMLPSAGSTGMHSCGTCPDPTLQAWTHAYAAACLVDHS